MIIVWLAKKVNVKSQQRTGWWWDVTVAVWLCSKFEVLFTPVGVFYSFRGVFQRSPTLAAQQ